jgi:hypothetical protein
MRFLLILVIILNVMDALGVFIKTFLHTEEGLLVKIGSGLDAALWSISLVVIATAVLKLLPYKRNPERVD